MAAPAPTARQTPSGIRLKNGFRTKITLARDPDISLWEKEVQAMGFEGGEPVDTTTMFNDIFMTSDPAKLIKVTQASMVCGYDPLAFDQCIQSLNVHTTITVTFADGSTRAEFGWLRSFVPQNKVLNQMPLANCVFEFGSQDSSSAEQAGVTTNVAGT